TWLALAVAALSGAAWLALLASDILGTSLADVCLHGGAWPVLFDTRFGLVWCMRLALALLLGILILWPATPGTGGGVHLMSDMVHLLAAGAWLGGLPAFVWSLWRARRTAKPAWLDFAIRSTRRFSVVGM